MFSNHFFLETYTKGKSYILRRMPLSLQLSYCPSALKSPDCVKVSRMKSLM